MLKQLFADRELPGKHHQQEGDGWTTYSDYTKENPRGLGEAMASMDKDVYSRTNKVFGVSVNYKF